jgi:curved DNA-binding protein CbpA
MSHLYGVLGVPKDAEAKQVKAAYWTLAKVCHPDIPGGSTERFTQISLAYATLGNRTRRATYDAELRALARHRLKNAVALMAASFAVTVGSGMFVAGVLLRI